MSGTDDAQLRNVIRELLAELGHANGNGNGPRPAPPVASGEGDAAPPQVPAPPIARVHRPSGWVAPAESAPAATPAGVVVEHVELRSDADLDAFVRRLENPRDRAAILAGALRFQLVSGPVSPAASATLRVEKGAVTERTVREAARTGARLVLSSRAVLTPMARDRARSLGVEIEKERPC